MKLSLPNIPFVYLQPLSILRLQTSTLSTRSVEEIPRLVATLTFFQCIFYDHEIAYIFLPFAGKFACRILIQGFSFALPVTLTMPTTIGLLFITAEWRKADPCIFNNFLPNYLFIDVPIKPYMLELLTKEVSSLLLLILLRKNHVILISCFIR